MAALFVNVKAKIFDGSTPVKIKYAILYVKTLVFPEPAPADIIWLLTISVTACFCSELNWSKKFDGVKIVSKSFCSPIGVIKFFKFI